MPDSFDPTALLRTTTSRFGANSAKDGTTSFAGLSKDMAASAGTIESPFVEVDEARVGALSGYRRSNASAGIMDALLPKGMLENRLFGEGGSFVAHFSNAVEREVADVLVEMVYREGAMDCVEEEERLPKNPLDFLTSETEGVDLREGVRVDEEELEGRAGFTFGGFGLALKADGSSSMGAMIVE